MNNRFQLFYWAMVAIAILLSAVTATGQTVALGEINASAGEEVIVPLNFTDITAAGSAAFYIEFNQDVLTYVNFQNAIPELSGNALIVNYIPGLYLTIQWFTLSSAVNFPDGTAIELIFDYAGGDTDVSFIEGSYVKDASNPPNTLAVTFVNGSVTGQSGSDQSAWNGTGNWMEE
ncbi:MAG: hypothetical protein KDC05_11510, partial [Bacteroidales bacterium]|nr:hypothetical protein [Bacteroidales bacterium]